MIEDMKNPKKVKNFFPRDKEMVKLFQRMADYHRHRCASRGGNRNQMRDFLDEIEAEWGDLETLTEGDREQ